MKPTDSSEPDERNELEKAIDAVIDNGGKIVLDKDSGGIIQGEKWPPTRRRRDESE